MDDDVVIAIFIPFAIFEFISLLIDLVIIISIFAGNPIIENTKNVLAGLTWFGIAGLFSLSQILPRLYS